MEGLFVHVFNVILPVLICAGVGYGMARFNAKFDHAVVGDLVKNIGYPTLIISHLSAAKIELGSFLTMLGASFAAIACFGLLGAVVLKVMRLPLRAFLTPMMNGNVGNIGLPITLLALGDAGMAYTMGFVVAVLVSIFTVGMWIPAGSFSLKSLVTSPIIYAVILALILMGTGTRLPAPIETSFNLLGGVSIPLMLLMLGHTLATLRIGTMWQASVLTGVHLIMGVVIGLGLSTLIGMQDTARGAFILCCLMPSSVATYLFIEAHVPERAPDVAGFILVSTLASIVVLPLALSYLI